MVCQECGVAPSTPRLDFFNNKIVNKNFASLYSAANSADFKTRLQSNIRKIQLHKSQRYKRNIYLFGYYEARLAIWNKIS